MLSLHKKKLVDLVQGEQWPELLDVNVLDAHNIVLSLHVDNSISWFAGHFPEQAVLPGVVQVHWAAQISRTFFVELAVESQFKQASNVKFKTVLLPDKLASLKLSYDNTKNKIQFSYYSDSETYSSGVLVFDSI